MTPLSDLELTVLALVADGHTNTGAGRELGMTKAAVSDRLRHARRKLGARTTAHAVALACRRGLLDAPRPALPDCARFIDPVPHRTPRHQQVPAPGRACARCGIDYGHHPGQHQRAAA